MATLRLLCGRSVAEVTDSLDAMEAHLLDAGATEPEAMQLRLVAEEIVTNIARCAWPEGEARQFTVELAAEARPGGLLVRLTTTDDGTPFDPTTQPPPDLEAALEDRRIGGLGMFLVHEMTDRQHYARQDGQNRLTVERLLPRAA
jgi:serine/threonine-protein kinase RsbW